MTADDDSKPRRQGRPRSARAHQAILDATLELIAEQGIHGTSIEAIASRAGVGKTTIYRRWSSKEALILDALHEIDAEVTFINTGNLREDLIAISKDILKLRLSNPLLLRLFYRLFGEFQYHPEFLRVYVDKVLAGRMLHAIHFVEQAQVRKEIDPKLDPILAITLIGGPLVYYAIIAAMFPVSIQLNDLPEQIVDVILRGIKPPLGIAGEKP